jgi:hypothetical protein
MNDMPDDRSVRFARWWVQRYTAGLAPHQAEPRRAEIDSDIAEHQRCRELDGWTPGQISTERATRLMGGMVSDLGWRHDILTSQARLRSFVRVSLLCVTSLAALVVATFHAAFAAYVLGSTSVADQTFLGGLASYADEVGRPVASPVAALIIGTLGVVLLVAAIARPVSPMMANVLTIWAATPAVLFFWLGVWPIAVIAIIGSVADLAIRTSHAPLRR